MTEHSLRKLSIRLGQERDRPAIYRIRHDVYAKELGQHQLQGSGTLHDLLDDFNHYIVAEIGGELAGFISITPPGFGRYSIDKYIARDDVPLDFDETLYEMRILTVAGERRRGRIALVLMYAAFRWIEEQGGQQIVSIGRREVLNIYLRLGMKPLGQSIQSGAVTFELLAANIQDLRSTAEARHQDLIRLQAQIDWDLDIPFLKAPGCFHGGAFFEAIGTDFRTLERKNTIISADVLDAWFPPSPDVLETLSRHLDWALRTSPPTHAEGLCAAIAHARGVAFENVLPGAGSSDLIYLAFRHWLTPRSRALILDPTYGEYAHILERVIACRVDRIALRREEGYRVDLSALKSKLAAGYDLAVIVNPNSPTGRHVPRAEMEHLLAALPGKTRVWIDETYIDYVGTGQSLERYAARNKQVVVCKSMSKVYALSGARAAYLCAAPAVISELRALTPPWAVSLPAQIAAVRALEDAPYYADKYRETHRLREKLVAGLRRIGIEEIVHGKANFIMFHLSSEHPEAQEVVLKCREQGVFLRDLASMGQNLGSRAIRIAVKDELSNLKVLSALKQAIKAPRSPSRVLRSAKGA